MMTGIPAYISNEKATPMVRMDQTAVEKKSEAPSRLWLPISRAARALAPKAIISPRQLISVVTGITRLRADTASSPTNCARAMASKVLANCPAAAVRIEASRKLFRAFEMINVLRSVSISFLPVYFTVYPNRGKPVVKGVHQRTVAGGLRLDIGTIYNMEIGY